MTDRPLVGDPAGHLDAETLSNLQEGLVLPEAAEAARDHLHGCESCAADAHTLADISQWLSSAADTGQVPVDVAQRIAAALAAEPAVSPAGAATVTPLETASTRRGGGVPQVRGMRFLQAAAVIVIALAGIGIAVSAQRGANDAATSSAGSAPNRESAGQTADSATYPVTASNRDWTQDTVVAAVPELLAGTLAPTGAASRAAASPEAGGDQDSGATPRLLADNDAARLARGPVLAECVGTLYRGPVTPLAVDIARWKGAPAGVIVLPTEGDVMTVDVYVVKPSCPPGDFLFFARQARP